MATNGQHAVAIWAVPGTAIIAAEDLSLAQQVRQLGEVDGHAPSFACKWGPQPPVGVLKLVSLGSGFRPGHFCLRQLMVSS